MVGRLDDMSEDEMDRYYNEINSDLERVSAVISTVNHDIHTLREKARAQAEELIRALEMAAEGDMPPVDPEQFRELALVLKAGITG